MAELLGGVCEFSTELERLSDGVYRVCIPLENIYTTAFIFTGDDGLAVYDTGSDEDDVRRYILPILAKFDAELKYIVISHMHHDHSGGASALLAVYPTARVVADVDGELLFGRYRTVRLPGHSPDCMGILDESTRTLYSGDCLQQYGITRFPTALEVPDEYPKSLDRVRHLKPKTIIASHNYVPCGWRVDGEAEVDALLAACEDAI